MAVVEIPQLPSLMAITSGKHTYLTTYKNKWDPIAKKVKRIKGANKTVGKILGNAKVGVIEWTPEFIARFPQLASLEARRVFDKKYGSKNLYKIEFTPQDEMLSVTAAVNLRKLNAGATWVLDRVVAGTPLTAALQRVFAPFNRHKKLLALAYYLLISNNSALHLYPEFAAMTRLPWRRTLSSGTISRLLAGITDNDIDKC